MKKRTVFEADDGTPFDTAAACHQYERALGELKAVEGFLLELKTQRGKELTDLQRNFARHVINKWENYKLDNTGDAPEGLDPDSVGDNALASALRRQGLASQ